MDQAEPVQAQPKPEDERRALFAAAGERLYLIEKLQAEYIVIRDKLDKQQPSYPPATPAPAAESPKETAPTTE